MKKFNAKVLGQHLCEHWNQTSESVHQVKLESLVFPNIQSCYWAKPSKASCLQSLHSLHKLPSFCMRSHCWPLRTVGSHLFQRHPKFCRCLVLEPTGFSQVYLRVEETNNTETFSSSKVHDNIHVDPHHRKEVSAPIVPSDTAWQKTALWEGRDFENGLTIWSWTLELCSATRSKPHIWKLEAEQSVSQKHKSTNLQCNLEAGTNLLSTDLIMPCPALRCSHLPPITVSSIHHSRAFLTCDL